MGTLSVTQRETVKRSPDPDLKSVHAAIQLMETMTDVMVGG